MALTRFTQKKIVYTSVRLSASVALGLPFAANAPSCILVLLCSCGPAFLYLNTTRRLYSCALVFLWSSIILSYHSPNTEFLWLLHYKSANLFNKIFHLHEKFSPSKMPIQNYYCCYIRGE